MKFHNNGKVNGRMNKWMQFITDPVYRLGVLSSKGFYDRMPDEKYLKIKFKARMGKKLDLNNPRTFNEKLQWLKLHDRRPEYTTMVDKHRVKDYVTQVLGEEYVIPTLGVWDRFEDIDFDALPDQFVLKCTHDSGGLIVCKDKSKLDLPAAKKKIEKSLNTNYYLHGREWPYKDVPRKIIAEQFMTDEHNKNGLTDYKFYCFNGEPRFLYVSESLDNHDTAHISYLNLDWTFAPYSRSDYAVYTELPCKPVLYEKMLDMCKKLSAGTAFLRVDLYEINSQIYFSELTFFPGSGFTAFADANHDIEVGEMLVLPSEKRQ